MYSKKPEHEAYKLTYHMSFEKDDEDEFIRDDIGHSNHAFLCPFSNVAVQDTKNPNLQCGS